MHSSIAYSLLLQPLVLGALVAPAVHKVVARSSGEIGNLRSLWEQLLKKSPRTLFQRFSWNRLAAETFGDRSTPLVVAVESDAGAAIIPATVNHATRRLELIGEKLFDYRDVLHIGDMSVLRTAWHLVAEFGLALSVTAIAADAQERWKQFALEEFAHAPGVHAGAITEADFRAGHSRVASRLRKLQRKGIALREYSGLDRGLVERLYQLKGDQFAGHADGLFQDRSRREFMVEIAAEEGTDCKVYTLEEDSGALAAGLVTFRDGGTRCFYTIYFDPRWAAYSPGIALVFEVSARSLAEGLNCDYMTGEYPYKLRFANASRRLYRVEASADEIASITSQDLERRVA